MTIPDLGDGPLAVNGAVSVIAKEGASVDPVDHRPATT
jgi:hypothetical protein